MSDTREHRAQVRLRRWIAGLAVVGLAVPAAGVLVEGAAAADDPAAVRLLNAGLLASTRTSTSTATASTSPSASSSPTASPTSSPTPSPTASVLPWTPDHYNPPPGPKFNNPLDADESHTIARHIRRAIASVGKGEKIRIFSWNIKSKVFENALIAAHDRGVSVRILMSNGLAEGQDDRGSYARLKHELAQRQSTRRPDMTSWVRTCVNSCRGQGGAAHSKFLVFSRVYQRTNVVMVGSPNLTSAASNNQWNDLVTLTNRPGLYARFIDVFNEASRDRPVDPPYVQYTDGRATAWFTPYTGGESRDPVLNLLNEVRCSGATWPAGAGGTTIVRIAADSIVSDRGLLIAKRIRALNNQGCRIVLMYSVIGKQVGDVLYARTGAGPVPAKHYVQDLDCDGVYDTYLHMKAIAVSGHVGNVTNAFVTLEGSNNWSYFGAASDDAGLIMNMEAVVRKYSAWIGQLWRTQPPYHGESGCGSSRSMTTTARPVAGGLQGALQGVWGAPREVLTSATAWKYAKITD